MNHERTRQEKGWEDTIMSISIGMNQAKQLLEKGMGQAEELIREPSKIDELLLQLENYLKEVPVIGETVADLPLMVSMIKGYITKSYTQVSPKVIAALLAAIIYLVKKGDLIPDNMPAIGKADDLAVLTFALKMCEPELKEFAAWRETQMGRFSGEQEEDLQEAKEQEAGWQEPEKRENAEGIEKVYNFLNDAQTYYLATVDGTKPRVRPFGTILLYDGKLYIQTGKVKDVSRQIRENPFVEICAFMNGTWLRIACELVDDDNYDAKVAMLEKMPSLKGMYSADDDNMQVFYLKDATATFSSFVAGPEVINF